MGVKQIIDVDKLVIDSQNPRFEEVTGEEDAIFSILDEQQTGKRNKILVLAQSIAEEGLNPTEELTVTPIPESEHFLVKEGNRRVTAIKLSLHPERIPESFAHLSKQFSQLSEMMESRRQIECYVTEDSSEIQRILRSRHTGENGGAGLVKWNSSQSARFSQVGNQQASRANTLVDDLVDRFGDTELTRTAAAIPATNLGRLISTPDVRKILGIEADGDTAFYVGGHDDVLLDVLRTVDQVGLQCINRKADRLSLARDAAKRLEPEQRPQSLAQDVIPGLENPKRSDIQSASLKSNPEDAPSPTAPAESISPNADDLDSNGTGCESNASEKHSSSEKDITHEGHGGISHKGDIRRKPVTNRRARHLFGIKLRPKDSASNDLYRGIELIDKMYLSNPEGYAPLLPIMGFSMRLLLDIIAKQYYESQNPPEDHGDNAYKVFLKEVAKPHLKKKIDSSQITYLALAAEWVNGNYNLDGILAKWAHGTMPVDRDALVNQSELIALIISELWSD